MFSCPLATCALCNCASYTDLAVRELDLNTSKPKKTIKRAFREAAMVLNGAVADK